jgi:hypothetical protein
LPYNGNVEVGQHGGDVFEEQLIGGDEVKILARKGIPVLI